MNYKDYLYSFFLGSDSSGEDISIDNLLTGQLIITSNIEDTSYVMAGPIQYDENRKCFKNVPIGIEYGDTIIKIPISAYTFLQLGAGESLDFVCSSGVSVAQADFNGSLVYIFRVRGSATTDQTIVINRISL